MSARENLIGYALVALPDEPATAKCEELADAFRAEVLAEVLALIEDRACDADFTEDPAFIVGLRSAGDVVRRLTKGGTS